MLRLLSSPRLLAVCLLGANVAGCVKDDSDTDPDPASTTDDATTSTSQPTTTTPTTTTDDNDPTTGEPAEPGACQVLGPQVDVSRILDHLTALETIAQAHDGNRAAGTAGYTASRDYIVETLAELGLVGTPQNFGFDFHLVLSPGTFERTAPDAHVYVHGVDFLEVTFSGTGEVTAPVIPIDLDLGPGNSSTSGCQAADFAGFPAGAIALIQRGSCTYSQKIANAEAAGAAAVIMFNQGDSAGRMGLVRAGANPTQPGVYPQIPAIMTTYAVGETLAGLAAPQATVHTDTIAELRETWNIVVETAGPDTDVLMVGAHLDSVLDGPGINDNGTGSATLLEVARLVAGCTPARKIRLAWWGAEEWGLHGSNFYVAQLSAAERSNIAAYLNFDMIGSPNYIHARYDGDGSAFGSAGAPGSDTVEAFLADHFAEHGVPLLEVPHDGRSDYAAFLAVGIPTGGLFTGAEQPKTAEQAELFGGDIGGSFDPCYHKVCDTVANVNADALAVQARAVVSAVETFGLVGAGLAHHAAPVPDLANHNHDDDAGDGDPHGHGGCHGHLGDRQ